MSNKNTGLVKWFNEEKALALSPKIMVQRTFLFTFKRLFLMDLKL